MTLSQESDRGLRVGWVDMQEEEEDEEGKFHLEYQTREVKEDLFISDKSNRAGVKCFSSTCPPP